MSKYQKALDRQKVNVKVLRDMQFIEYGEDFRLLQSLINKHIKIEQQVNDFKDKLIEWANLLVSDGINSKKTVLEDIVKTLKEIYDETVL